MRPIRASDAERERTTETLRRACSEGRLDADELDERLAVALRARTRPELAGLVADLPRAPLALRPAAPRRRSPVALPALAGLFALVVLVLEAVPDYMEPALGLVVGALAIVAVLLLGALAPFLVIGGGIAWLVRRLTEGSAHVPRRQL